MVTLFDFMASKQPSIFIPYSLCNHKLFPGFLSPAFLTDEDKKLIISEQSRYSFAALRGICISDP